VPTKGLVTSVIEFSSKRDSPRCSRQCVQLTVVGYTGGLSVSVDATVAGAEKVGKRMRNSTQQLETMSTVNPLPTRSSG